MFSENTPPAASFTGSMQLLAGVKLCTDRHITNHPHYENKFLRERTKQVTRRIPLYLLSWIDQIRNFLSYSSVAVRGTLHKRPPSVVGGGGGRRQVWGGGQVKIIAVLHENWPGAVRRWVPTCCSELGVGRGLLSATGLFDCIFTF